MPSMLRSLRRYLQSCCTRRSTLRGWLAAGSGGPGTCVLQEYLEAAVAVDPVRKPGKTSDTNLDFCEALS